MSRSTTSTGGRRRLGLLAIAPTVLAAVVAAVPSAAQAQTFTDSDPVGDMVDFSAEVPVPAPEQRTNDVTSTRLTHGATRIRVRVEYADLRRLTEHDLFVGMVTDEGVRRQLGVSAFPERPAGQAYLLSGGYRELRCAVRHSIDYADDVVTASFPRRCASSPRWVRFRVGAMHADGESRMYADDALRDRPLNRDDRNWALSGRVHHG